MYSPGQTFYQPFPVYSGSDLANADSAPTGIVYKNGAAISPAVTVTVTNTATGKYTASFTVPAAALADVLQLEVTTIVNGLVFTDYYDVPLSIFNNTGQTALLPAAVNQVGVGSIVVNQDTGGTDALRYVDAHGVGIGGAEVLIYLASDWPTSPANVQRRTSTNADGRWGPVFLTSGTYLVIFDKQAVSGPDVSATFTV